MSALRAPSLAKNPPPPPPNKPPKTNPPPNKPGRTGPSGVPGKAPHKIGAHDVTTPTPDPIHPWPEPTGPAVPQNWRPTDPTQPDPEIPNDPPSRVRALATYAALLALSIATAPVVQHLAAAVTP